MLAIPSTTRRTVVGDVPKVSSHDIPAEILSSPLEIGKLLHFVFVLHCRVTVVIVRNFGAKCLWSLQFHKSIIGTRQQGHSKCVALLQQKSTLKAKLQR